MVFFMGKVLVIIVALIILVKSITHRERYEMKSSGTGLSFINDLRKSKLIRDNSFCCRALVVLHI